MKKLIPIAICVVVVLSCSKNSGGGGSDFTTDCSTAKSWKTDVSTVISATCAYTSGCHGSGSTNGPGALTSYQLVYNNRAAIRAAVASGTMPQSGSLTTTQKNAILCWIDSGAPNN